MICQSAYSERIQSLGRGSTVVLGTLGYHLNRFQTSLCSGYPRARPLPSTVRPDGDGGFRG
ncbi:6KDa glycine-rich protein [Broad bean necrosis virus]|uniref:6kDa glycine-rich protein n=1 Tax=Broad bean necrosis virus TaxID=79918 RepID=Q9YPH0_9VIRU|nr:6KDa glycine-rich protein [Broad bean necrosis virus]BAA34699.1 6KDa glycine-rich protein [Broad bean necrosis virus]